jgi:hypothetical protein
MDGIKATSFLSLKYIYESGLCLFYLNFFHGAVSFTSCNVILSGIANISGILWYLTSAKGAVMVPYFCFT